MNAENPRQNTEAGEGEAREMDRCQCARGQEEAMNRETLPLLAAYGDATLSLEAGNQLVQMAEDTSHPAYAGEDLPAADKAALLRKAALRQKNK